MPCQTLVTAASTTFTSEADFTTSFTASIHASRSTDDSTYQQTDSVYSPALTHTAVAANHAAVSAPIN